MEAVINSKTLETFICPPWLDLADLITELILEHLPLPDYLRFASVCQKWQSIQKDHRFRYSPSQPPMSPPIPWPIPPNLGESSHLTCYSPSSRTLYHLRCIDTSFGVCLFSCHGWIFFVEAPSMYFLLNPITGVKIQLPFFSLSLDFWFRRSGAILAPPSDSSCTVLLVAKDDAFLYRVNSDDACWTHLRVPGDA